MTGLTLTARGRRLVTIARFTAAVLMAAATIGLFVALIVDAAMYQ